ncbi:MAG TPA: cardiolipin synthase [Pirellulaceae bacterium]|nr:cardiolipin synthase [Pirellulaceae bacterium]
MSEFLANWWPYLVFLFDITISLLASSHAVLNKRDVRSAIGWSSIIWLAPVLGSVLYVMFGVNRIARRAQSLRAKQPQLPISRSMVVLAPDSLGECLGNDRSQLNALARLGSEVTDLPLLAGNRVAPLNGGANAYPAMLGAIDRAEHSITLSTYIFDNDPSGRKFLDALTNAVKRGVQVRVIVDDVGQRYSWNSIVPPLRAAGVQVAQFLPTLVPWHFRYANLRSHRKIMVVDGRYGFTGGMNIRHGNTLAPDCRAPIQDLHFSVEGPVVAQMQETFAWDWGFCTGEVLTGELWFPRLEPAGTMLARGIPDGPDEDFEELRLILLGALACAEKSILIVTPYFIPDDAILTSLNIAALRGVQVDVVIPDRSNLRLVQWAMVPVVRLLLDSGVCVWRSAGPFDHSKILVVDNAWTTFGSANWDARSLRLNFEFNVEVFDCHLAQQLTTIVQEKIAHSQRITAAEIDARPLPIKLRDGVARLATPYL